MTTRTPSDRNPFKMPAELRTFPLLYRALIRPIREADMREGREFLRRFYNGMHAVHVEIADQVASVWDVHSPITCPPDLLVYLKDIVGFNKDFDYITSRLSDADLRRLIQLAIPLWKQLFSELGIVNLIRLLTGRNAIIYNWFYYRTILGEVILSEEQLGYDFWLIGGGVTYYDEFHSQVRLMDNGTVDRQLLLDLVALERVSSERVEVAVVDFLDQFDAARDKWETIQGSTPASLTPDKTFLIPAGTIERALMASDTYSNYAIIHKTKLAAGASDITLFYLRDPTLPRSAYEIEVKKNTVVFARWWSGTRTPLLTVTPTFPIHEGLWYKVRITIVDEGVATHRIKVYIDGNEVINTTYTGTPLDGRVAFGASGAYVEIDNTEVFRIPLRLAEIGPGGVTTSPNFFT